MSVYISPCVHCMIISYNMSYILNHSIPYHDTFQYPYYTICLHNTFFIQRISSWYDLLLCDLMCYYISYCIILYEFELLHAGLCRPVFQYVLLLYYAALCYIVSYNILLILAYNNVVLCRIMCCFIV